VLSMRLITASRRRAVSSSLNCWSVRLGICGDNMKRKTRDDISVPAQSIASIKTDLTEKQLAAFAAAALAYNILEDQIDALLLVATRIPDWLFAEVSSRINGLDGKIAIIQEAITRSSISPKDAKALTEAVATFGDFKKTRDTMIHARIIRTLVGTIGRGTKQRGKSPFEILLNVDALSAFFDHIEALERELSSGAKLSNSAITLNQSALDDPNRSRFEEERQAHEAQFQESHNLRQSLKQLPKFPDEDELRKVVNQQREAQTAALMGWFQPWSEPGRHRHWNPALYNQSSPSTPLPLAEANKNQKK
jgi:hypothetical protein